MCKNFVCGKRTGVKLCVGHLACHVKVGYVCVQGITADDKRSSEYFYLYRHGGLGKEQLAKLRKSLKVILKTRP